jgi:inorganic pyrophosphatase
MQKQEQAQTQTARQMPNLTKLKTFTDDNHLHMVVETPRGSSLKFRYDADVEVFKVSRALALGITYPFDWGFIPGTKGDDGDPVDALAIHDASTYPGMVLECRIIGVVAIDQKAERGRERNPRLILIPTWNDRLAEFEKVSGLPKRLRQEVEQFFLSATFFTGKDVKLKGWHGPKVARELLRSSQQK